MRKHPFIKFGVVVGVCYGVYNYVLDDRAKGVVRDTAQRVIDGVVHLIDMVQGRKPFESTQDVEAAQHWAAQQWDDAGFGA